MQHKVPNKTYSKLKINWNNDFRFPKFVGMTCIRNLNSITNWRGFHKINLVLLIYSTMSRFYLWQWHSIIYLYKVPCYLRLNGIAKEFDYYVYIRDVCIFSYRCEIISENFTLCSRFQISNSYFRSIKKL